jgi:hypothetical protein
MASGRPVISTTMAGIPEAVIDRETGLLVPPGESGFLSDALETLCRDIELRKRYGSAGRKRVEEHFQITTTIQPLLKLFGEQGQRLKSTPPFSAPAHDRFADSKPRIAYLIDRWPDRTLRSFERELRQLEERKLEVVIFACEFVCDFRLTGAMKRLALRFQFLPDAMAIEAEWQANRRLVLALEDDRANESPRVPVDLFLRQARYAIALRRMFAQMKIGHVHATNSRALICGVLLKKLLSITLSASIEAKPTVSHEVIESALRHAVGARISNRKLAEEMGPPFVFHREPANSTWARAFEWSKKRVEFGQRQQSGQNWADLLDRWTSEA